MEKIIHTKSEIDRVVDMVSESVSSKNFDVGEILRQQSVKDFINENRLGEEFHALAVLAKNLKGKHFRARVRPELSRIIYECFCLETGELLGQDRRIRGNSQNGEFEFYVFTLPAVTIQWGVGVSATNYSKPEKFEQEQRPALYFADPSIMRAVVV